MIDAPTTGSVVATADGLFSPTVLEDLWEHAVARASDFVPTRVIAHAESSLPVVDPATRRNLHLPGKANVPTHVMDQLRREIPLLAPALQGEHDVDFGRATYEGEITATLDGGFFVAHIDNGHPLIQDRSLSFVLFFGAAPRAFSGGELLVENDWREEDRIMIFDAVRAGALGAAGVAVTVEPAPGRLAVFPSSRLHEVAPVTTSASFADSRFTVTGFVRSRVEP